MNIKDSMYTFPKTETSHHLPFHFRVSHWSKAVNHLPEPVDAEEQAGADNIFLQRAQGLHPLVHTRSDHKHGAPKKCINVFQITVCLSQLTDSNKLEEWCQTKQALL